jgi:ATP-dependent Clp protease protease subunit
MMDDETWFNAKKAVELGFADEILFTDSDKPEEEEEEKKPPKEPEEGDEGDEEKEKDGKKKKPPFEQDSLMFSQRAMNNSFLSKVSKGKPGNGIPINQLEKRLSLIKH